MRWRSIHRNSDTSTGLLTVIVLHMALNYEVVRERSCPIDLTSTLTDTSYQRKRVYLSGQFVQQNQP